jgi:VanZ family protein
MLRKNKYSITVALVILVLSLTSSKTFSNTGFIDIPYIDKIAHFGFYFLFMSVIIFEHRNNLLNTRQLLLAALVPFTFGSMIELLQSGIDIINRSGEILDLVANIAGVVTALFLWLFIRPYHYRKVAE